MSMGTEKGRFYFSFCTTRVGLGDSNFFVSKIITQGKRVEISCKKGNMGKLKGEKKVDVIAL